MLKNSPVAVITGISGQDGSYLSDFLTRRGYQVIGLVREASNAGNVGERVCGLQNKVQRTECDLTDLSQVISIIECLQPSEIYNLAAQSSVSQSFLEPIGTISFNIISVLNLLEAIRRVNPKIKFYQASSSEIFGNANSLPIREDSPISPINPYSISKASSYWITRNYREAYGLFSCSGFLFNHESYLRNENFFVKKVIREGIKIKRGEADVLEVGNVDVRRDFGWAPKYVEAMYLMLQQETPDDYIICSGRSISLRSIIEYVFNYLEVPLDRVVVSKKLYRPTEITDIYGDNRKAKNILGWEYDMSFYEVLELLINEEINGFDGQD